MSTKISKYFSQGVIAAIVYAILMWLFNWIFDKDPSISWKLILQGVTFGVLYVLLDIFVPLTKPTKKS